MKSVIDDADLEKHRTGNLAGFRAAVMGATMQFCRPPVSCWVSLPAHGSRAICSLGCGRLVAGAMSMAAGPVCSVHSRRYEQRIWAEKMNEDDSKGEHEELAAIYVGTWPGACPATEVANR